MNNQIKARGWLWDRSLTPTQWIAYKCDSVIFCPGWETSRGCKLEMQHCIANKIAWEVQE